MNENFRLRFAPAPTGMMHLGNVRTALMNFMFSKQHNATFVLRIEDTDPQRNFDPQATQIIADLDWLGIDYDEGPYFQSERANIYKNKLDKLVQLNATYRCFCTQEELNKKRERQLALRIPPRYDRACLDLTQEKINQKLKEKLPFIWRIKLDHSKTITINDLARGPITFECKNFSDFPITRSDGTFTFMFANCVDDIMMKITHVFRGEDHLSNTAGQAALFALFDTPLPTFWHMPILCNIEGKKLSKRDFGFALADLRKEGYAPEAIVNYLATTGTSFGQELFTLEQLIQQYDFNAVSTGGQITYDPKQLIWLNKKWIHKLEPKELAKRCLTKLQNELQKDINIERATELLTYAQTEMDTLNDCVQALRFVFMLPRISADNFTQHLDNDVIRPIINIIKAHITDLKTPELFIKEIKHHAHEADISLKQLFHFLRIALMGTTQGYGILELLYMLETEESMQRLQRAIDLLA